MNEEPGVATTRIDSWRLVRTVVIFCIVSQVALVLADGLINYGHMLDGFLGHERSSRSVRKLFNMASEDGIGTWFASLQTLACGLVMGLIWLKAGGRQLSFDRALGSAPFLPRKLLVSVYSRYWTVLLAVMALFFVFLATDDAISIHEKLGSVFRRWAESAEVGGLFHRFPSYPWQVVFMPVYGFLFLVVLGYALVEFLENRDLLALLLCYGGFALLVAAIGIDHVEGTEGGWEGLVGAAEEAEYTVRHWAKVIEEAIEMAGFTCFLIAFLRHWLGRASAVEISFVGGSAQNS